MKIQWLGHACFIMTLSSGKTIITDPFDETVGYPLPKREADLVTVSHQHFDHNAVNVLPGKPTVIDNEGEHSFGEVKITGIPSFHDSNGGSQRGKNIIFVSEVEGLRICHLGDLGHLLETEQLNNIGSIDVLLIPVGGHFTIGPVEAVKVVEQLSPKYVLPMHYKTKYLDFPISEPVEFLNNYPGYQVARELVVDAEKMPAKMQVVLLELNS